MISVQSLFFIEKNILLKLINIKNAKITKNCGFVLFSKKEINCYTNRFLFFVSTILRFIQIELILLYLNILKNK